MEEGEEVPNEAGAKAKTGVKPWVLLPSCATILTDVTAQILAPEVGTRI